MCRLILTICFLSLPVFASASESNWEFAGNNLVFMAFITGFALFALAQVGYFLIQTLNREDSQNNRRNNSRKNH